MCSAEGTSQELFIVITVKEGGFFFPFLPFKSMLSESVLFKNTASNQPEEGDLGNDLALKGSREVLDTVLATF